MFIITKKVHRGRLAVSAILLVLTIAVLGAGLGLTQNIQAAEAAAQLQQPDPTGIKSDQDRVAYLESFGWLVADEPASVEEILIPETFDASYDEYLALQAEQGFDLTQYSGKTVKRYTYQVKNYPGLQEHIWASLLVYQKTIIGGEIYCSQGDGFTQGLEYPMKTVEE